MDLVRFLFGVIALLGALTASPSEASTAAQGVPRDEVLTSCCLQPSPGPMDTPRFVAGATTASSSSVRDASLQSAPLVVSPVIQPVAQPLRANAASIPRPSVRTFPLLI